MEVGPIFRVNAVFGWMPCHILQQKTEHISVSCHQLQCCVAVTAASLFLNFCFTVPNVKWHQRQIKPLNYKKNKQKKKPLLFI